MALAEAKNPCDISIVHKYKWETMTFIVFEMGTEEAVYNAFQALFKKFCKRDFCDEVRDFKIPEPEAVAS